ncbi:helix-turn-helix domain-containing protein [Amycolatopsis acidiphila]|nr:helix-turn-helix domain-containing protein [Amycolatopsis acidiphila]UIJ63595.1 helix-turn-helix domain-containing protein [Amycolatopsis acidiphila]GHG68037.1 transcriptional regulator [Amycolatopsis acidiphila]
MTGDNALRDFLVSRRAAIDPARAGLPVTHAGRRVPGLRREEVAALAGVSVAYYTKLEQGRVGMISDEVLSAVERALRLDELECLHLRALVWNAGRRRAGRSDPVKARPQLVAMIHALDPAPALVYGPRYDVLAANAAAKVLLDDFGAMPIADRNIVRWTFLNPRAKVVHPQWELVAGHVAAALRHITAERQADPLLAQLVGEMVVASPEFARHWSAYDLYEHGHGTKLFFNEAVGELTLRYETLAPAGDDGQNVVIYSADRGSPAEEKLRLLASWTAVPTAEPHQEPSA